jgi:hypothetical protein
MAINDVKGMTAVMVSCFQFYGIIRYPKPENLLDVCEGREA